MRTPAGLACLIATARGARAAFTMTASPATVVNATQAKLTASWTGVAGAASTDWVSAYCVGAPLAAFGPWTYVSDCAAFATGACSLTFDITDMSCGAPDAMEFRYYRDPSPYTFVGASNAVTWSGGGGGGGGAPRHVRVAYGASPQTEATVSWSSDSRDAPAVLRVSSAPGAYDVANVTAAAAETTVGADFCAAPAAASTAFAGFFHHAFVSGLKPATRYWVTPTQGGAVGAETSFVTGKPRGAAVASSFVVYADMSISGGAGAAGTAARVAARLGGADEPDFLLHVGDLSYGEGNINTWDAWMGDIEPYSSRLPYHVSIGNHEYDYGGDSANDPSGAGRMYHPPWWNGGGDSGGECGVAVARRFRMPATGNGVFWYSFAVANVHVAMISSEHDPNPGAPMGDWLAQDLAGVDRAVTPWVLVGIHRPIVETEMYAGDYAVAAGLRAILEPVLLANNVNVVVAGHYHSFQRSCRMASLKCVAPGAGAGIVHYTTGAAGASLDEVGLYPSAYIEKTILGKYGYSVFSAPNASALRMTFFDNADDSVGDDVWITQ